MLGLLIDLFSSLRGGGKRKALASVVARLKHEGFVESARNAAQQQAGGQVGASELQRMLPLTRPFAGDLVIAYAIENHKDYRFIGQDFLEANKISLEDLHEAALANTRAQLVKHIKVGRATNFMGIDSQMPGMAAAAALFPEFWKPFEHKHGPLVAAVPGRNFLAFLPVPASGPERDKALVQAWLMKCAATAMFDESANHALSAHCFDVRNGVFEVREGLGEQDPECAALLDTPRGQALMAECVAKVRG